MNADATWGKPWGPGGAAVECAGGVDVDTELVRAQAGGDVGMGFSEDVRVDAQGKGGGGSMGFGAGGEKVKLGRGFDVEDQDAGFEGSVELGGLLAYAGEDGFFCGCPGDSGDARKLAPGDDVEAGAVLCKQLDDGGGRSWLSARSRWCGESVRRPAGRGQDERGCGDRSRCRAGCRTPLRVRGGGSHRS